MAAGMLPKPPALKTAAAKAWFCDPAMGAWTNRMAWASKNEVCMAQLFPVRWLMRQAQEAILNKGAG
jgi:hypothetical protein